MTVARPSQVRWVADRPPGAAGGRPLRRRRPYTGPPAYPAPPRWGFPQLAWRWPTTVPGTGDGPADPEYVRTAGRVAVVMLRITAVAALAATVGELLRYGILVAGLSTAVPSGLVVASDTFVITAGLVTIVFALASLYLTLRWLLPARRLGARDRTVARSDGWVIAAIVVPLWNLFGALYLLAELEHSARNGDPRQRPRPSRAVWTWWGTWLLGGLLFILTVCWSFRDSVQAMADGVVLHAVTDAVAAVLAYVTARLVGWLTAMLVPADPTVLPLWRVLSVRDAAPTSERAPRSATAPR